MVGVSVYFLLIFLCLSSTVFGGNDIVHLNSDFDEVIKKNTNINSKTIHNKNKTT